MNMEQNMGESKKVRTKDEILADARKKNAEKAAKEAGSGKKGGKTKGMGEKGAALLLSDAGELGKYAKQAADDAVDRGYQRVKGGAVAGAKAVGRGTMRVAEGVVHTVDKAIDAGELVLTNAQQAAIEVARY